MDHFDWSFYEKLVCWFKKKRRKKRLKDKYRKWQQELLTRQKMAVLPWKWSFRTYRPVLLPVRHELQAFVHVGPHLVNMGHRVDGPGVVRGHSETLQRRDFTPGKCYISGGAEQKEPSEWWKCPPQIFCWKVEVTRQRKCSRVQKHALYTFSTSIHLQRHTCWQIERSIYCISQTQMVQWIYISEPHIFTHLPGQRRAAPDRRGTQVAAYCCKLLAELKWHNKTLASPTPAMAAVLLQTIIRDCRTHLHGYFLRLVIVAGLH